MSHVITLSEAASLISGFASAYDPVTNGIPIGGVLSRAAFLNGLAQLPSSPDEPGIRAWMCMEEMGQVNKIFIATEAVNVDIRYPEVPSMLSTQKSCDESSFIYLPGNLTVLHFLVNTPSPVPYDITLSSGDTSDFRGKFINEYSPFNPYAVCWMERKECEDLAEQNGGDVYINYFFGYDTNEYPNRIRLIYFAVDDGTDIRLTDTSNMILERGFP